MSPFRCSARWRASCVSPPSGTDISGAQTGAAGQFVDDEEEIVLSEEVVDVSKHAVAKERIGLETETVTEQVDVDETVRKERVDIDGDDKLIGNDTQRGR